MAGEVNPMIRQWMTAMTSQQLHRVVATVTVSDQQVQQYIIRRPGPQVSVFPSVIGPVLPKS